MTYAHRAARAAITAGLCATLTLGAAPLSIFAATSAASGTQQGQQEKQGQSAQKATASSEGAKQDTAPAANADAVDTAAAPAAGAKSAVAAAKAARPAARAAEPQAATVAKIGTTEYATLSAAIAAAKPGETVTLTASTAENVAVRKKITVTAAAGAVYSGTMSVHDGATVTGMAFELDGQNGTTTSIAVRGAGDVKITNNTFALAANANQSQSYNGIHLSEGAARVDIEGNTFTYGTVAKNKDRVAVNIQGNPTIRTVNVKDNTLNVTGANAGTGTILLVSAFGNSAGYGIADLAVTGNTVNVPAGIGANVRAVAVQGVSGLTFTGNTIKGAYLALEGGAATGQKTDNEQIKVGGNDLKGTTVGYSFNAGSLADNDSLHIVEPDKAPASSTALTASVTSGKTTTAYLSLKDALAAAKDGDTVSLLADTVLSSRVPLTKQITLDGQGHVLNGQLYLMAGASESTIKNVHFVLDANTKYQNWPTSLYIRSASNVTITKNTFSIASDAPTTGDVPSLGARAVSVYVAPGAGEQVDGTKIVEGNVFASADSPDNATSADAVHYGILLTNEANSGSKAGITNTVVSGNTLVGGKALKKTRFLASYDAAATPRVGVTGLTISNNVLATKVNSATDLFIDFWGGTGNVTIAGNQFGPGERGILLRTQDLYQGKKKVAPQENVTIKLNSFAVASAVVDNGGIKDAEQGGLTYDAFIGTKDANTFAANTVPYAGGTAKTVSTYGVRYYDAAGKLIGWETATKDGLLNKVPLKDASIVWYTDQARTQAFDVTKDKVTGNLALYAKVKTFNVTFDDGVDGTTDSVVAVEAGKAVAKPTDPKREGYTFGGWFADQGFTKAYDFATPVTGDITLHAKWTKANEGNGGQGGQQGGNGGTNTPSDKKDDAGSESTGSNNADSNNTGSSKKTSGTTGKKKLPKTGDDTIAVVAGVAAAGAAIAAAGMVTRKRSDRA